MNSTEMASCPACGENRNLERQSRLLAAETVWFERQAALHAFGTPFYPLRDGMRQLAKRALSNWFWACDECIHRGRALFADVTVQEPGLGTPFAAYVDRPFRCEDCHKPSIFNVEEQKHWYEELKFLIWSHPRHCAPCRANRRRYKRTHRELERMLRCLDVTDPEALDNVARLYAELGLVCRAAEFAARARNRRQAEQGDDTYGIKTR